MVEVAIDFNRDKKPDPLERYRQIFRALGVDEEINPELLKRFALLDTTETVADELQAVAYARRYNEYARRSDSLYQLSPAELKTVETATMVTDIGKTGHRDFDDKQQELIAAIYSIRENFKPHLMTIKEFFEKFYADTSVEKIALFKTLNLDPDTLTMREFFNLHAAWTYSLLEDSGLNDEVVVTASSHHLLEGVIPRNCIDLDTAHFNTPTVKKAIGKELVLVILLDKYDAAITRGKKDHGVAIAYLKDVVATNPIFEKLPRHVRTLFEAMILNLNEALGEERSPQESAHVIH